MGQDVDCINYNEADLKRFKEFLKKETDILLGYFKNHEFKLGTRLCGMELEAWLVDVNFAPAPKSHVLIRTMPNEKVVPEITKFNFEINSDPYPATGNALTSLKNELSEIWNECTTKASSLGLFPIAIGSLPTLEEGMLNLENLSPENRYAAINKRVMEMRGGRPVVIDIEGKDQIYFKSNNVISETAATSMQIHFGVTQETAARYYNASCIISSFMVACCANSPYFFGKELWDETRIAIFEQSVKINQLRKKDGLFTTRVTLGCEYVKECISELFIENAEDYDVLLPNNCSDDPKELKHLNMHNGTIWRWNRPVLGKNADGTPNLRIEHRVPAAGPTTDDIIANMALYIGLVEYFANLETPVESILDFEVIRKNFYKSAKRSFNARIVWLDDTAESIQDLLLNDLLGKAMESLQKLGFNQKDIDYYIGDIMHGRISNKQNGAAWQKAFMAKNPGQFDKMIKTYYENQFDNIPVHKWKV